MVKNGFLLFFLRWSGTFLCMQNSTRQYENIKPTLVLCGPWVRGPCVPEEALARPVVDLGGRKSILSFGPTLVCLRFLRAPSQVKTGRGSHNGVCLTVEVFCVRLIGGEVLLQVVYPMEHLEQVIGYLL